MSSYEDTCLTRCLLSECGRQLLSTAIAIRQHKLESGHDGWQRQRGARNWPSIERPVGRSATALVTHKASVRLYGDTQTRPKRPRRRPALRPTPPQPQPRTQ